MSDRIDYGKPGDPSGCYFPREWRSPGAKSRSEILDYQDGREARIKGVPRDRRKNVDWLRGWDDVQDDYIAEDAEARWKGGQEP